MMPPRNAPPARARPPVVRILAAATVGVMLAVTLACTPRERGEEGDASTRIQRLLRDGRYQDAEAEARTFLDATREAAGPESVATAKAIDLLVEALWRGGKAGVAESRALAATALETKERLLPADDLEIARSLNNMGNLLRLSGDVRQAEPIFERALEMREKKLGPGHPDVAQSLTGLAAARLDLGNRDEARALFERALAIREQALGPDSIEAAQSLNNLAALSRLSGDYGKARERLERAIAIWEKRLGPEHPNVGQAVENLAQTLQLSGNAAAARPLLERALRIKEHALGPDHPAVAQTLDALGNLLWTLGDSAGAEPLLARALAIQEKTAGPEHPNVASVLSTLGNLELARGDLSGAKALLERALRIREARLGPEHPDTADALNNLAIAVARSGDPLSAKALHQRALAIRRKVLGPDHPAVSDSLNNLANVLLDLGDLTAAGPLYVEALASRQRIFGEDHPRVAETLNNLGVLRSLEGDLPAARELHERALQIRRATFGAEQPALAESLHNLADVLSDLGDFDAARPLCEEALRIRRATFGPDHPAVAETLNNLGNIEFRTGHLAAAAETYAAALAIREKVLGPLHVATSASLNNVAGVSLLAGDVEKARQLFERALAIRQATFGPDHPQVALVLDNLGATALRAGHAKAAIAYRERAKATWSRAVGPDHVALVETWGGIADARVAAHDRRGAVEAEIRAEELARTWIRLSATRLAERRARRYEAATRRGLDIALTAVADRVAPSLDDAVLDAVVRSRAMVLDALVEAQRASHRLEDPVAEDLRKKLVAARSRLAASSFLVPDRLPAGRWRELVARARDEADRAEEALSARSHRPGAWPRRGAAGLREVASALPPLTSLVAFSRYRRVDPEHPRDAASSAGGGNDEYLAWVLHRRAGHPVAVPLGAAVPIDEAIRTWRREIEAARGTVPGAVSAAETRYRAAGERLRAVIWDPVVPHLGGSRTVLVVPDGLVSFVSLATLPSSSGPYLEETGPMFHYLSTERDTVRGESRSPRRDELLVVAAPEFGAAPAPVADSRGETRLRFGALPGALAEATDVSAAWGAGTGSRAKPRVLSGAEATEEAFKSEVGHYGVVHLATHGFVLGSRVDAVAATAPEGEPGAITSLLEENPLLRAGIALAGANRGGASRDSNGTEDGLVTAEEIAALDLTNLDWAVLSGCETGLGALDAAEGVLGMRRAFQLAGARSVILSLWPIEDASTRGWMRRLYAERGAGRSTVEATHRASSEVIASLRRAGRSTHPFYWGAFVACGEWR